MPVDVRAIRAAIVQTTIGGDKFIPTPPGTEDEAERVALDFSKTKKIPIIISIVQGGLEITRTLLAEKPSVYPEIDALAVGEHHTFPFPTTMHARVRGAVSARNRKREARYACSREGEHIRVTRLPLTPEETAACPEIPKVERVSRWALLNQLETKPFVVFDIEPRDQMRLRLAAFQKAKSLGWTVSCRAGKGIMTVYRTDNIVMAEVERIPMPDQSRATKYDLGRLSDPTAKLSFAITTADQQRLRMAVSQKARTTGWTIRCRLQDDGTMLVYRTDVPPAATDGDSAQTPHHA